MIVLGKQDLFTLLGFYQDFYLVTALSVFV